MTAPDFLVIGGMKCGSTTVYDDLGRRADVSFPDKELNFFNTSESSDPDKIERYQAQFTGEGLQGDVSTSYAMIPRYVGTAQRAFDALGSVPIVYMVRNPIERAISHHHHLQARSATSLSFAEALDSLPELVAFGQFEKQAGEWDKVFGESNVLVMPIESYSEGGLNDVLRHIGIIDNAAVPGHSNETASARVFTGRSRSLYESAAFQRIYVHGLRTMIPSGLRTAARNALLPKPPTREPNPSAGTLARLIPQFIDTVEFVRERTGVTWNLDETCEQLGDNP